MKSASLWGRINCKGQHHFNSNLYLDYCGNVALSSRRLGKIPEVNLGVILYRNYSSKNKSLLKQKFPKMKKGSKVVAAAGGLHQTKIGNFFKRDANGSSEAGEMESSKKKLAVSSPKKEKATNSSEADEEMESPKEKLAVSSPKKEKTNGSSEAGVKESPKKKLAVSSPKKEKATSSSEAGEMESPKKKLAVSSPKKEKTNGSSEAREMESPKKKLTGSSAKKDKKEERELQSKQSDSKDKNGKAGSSKARSSTGKKRRSESTSSDDGDNQEKAASKKSSKSNGKPEAKRQRRRIVVEDSSSEEEVASEEDFKVKSEAEDEESEEDESGEELEEEEEEEEAEDEEAVEEEIKPKRKSKAIGKKVEVKSKNTKQATTKTIPEKTGNKAPAQGSKPAVPPPKGWKPDYNPAKNKYHPIDDASWEKDQRVPYLALAKTLEAIEATSSRLKNMEILANFFRSVLILSPDDLRLSVYLCLNKLAPAYEGVELGVAETNVMKAIAQATGRSLDKIKSDAAAAGDLGIVAESSRSTQKTLFQPQPLTVQAVFNKLKEVAGMTGSASHAKKISMITSLLVACKYSEARYLARSLLGKLRIGLAEQSLLQAIAQACFLTPPEQDRSEWPPKKLDCGKKCSAETLKAKFEEEAYKVKSAFCECPNYDILVKALLEVGTDGLREKCKLTPGIPPRPMLAQPTKGVADVLERFDGIKFTCEYKYDGERAQIHLLEDGSINIYSRNQENNTSKYPDIISRFSKCIKGDVKSCILDTEAVAWDIEKEQILPFQVLSTRKRKDADEAEIKVQVCIFAFDLIYLNGESLIKKPLIERRELLREHFQAVTGEFVFATSVDTDSMEEVQEFLEESVKGNCEGLMVKTLDAKASYELAKRSQKWLKLKKDYLDSGGDSLDLVVIGGFNGRGKRTGTYGGFLLACYDPDEEVYQTICKLGTGFSDEQLLKHTESLKPHIIPNPKSYYRFNTQLTPDHWFDAVEVWEVKCADLSLSPVHTAAEGMADPQRGISLRFPRFMRLRDDKKIEDATTASQVADMYKSQEVVKNSTNNKKGIDDDDDFY
ncbi:unnamed protein product [Orchesella dallaii]|uniref:DNA ligase n=1 Tax=Orchesella dallaii TaxID=48710 RepID=A0ABP1R8T7_9HEXA